MNSLYEVTTAILNENDAGIFSHNYASYKISALTMQDAIDKAKKLFSEENEVADQVRFICPIDAD